MRYVQINDLEPGMIVGEDIFGNYDLLYAPKGEVLTARLITGLERLGLLQVAIMDEDEVQEKKEIKPSIPVKKPDYSVIINELSKEIIGYRLLNKDCFRPIRETIINVFNYLILQDDLLKNLHQLYEKDPYSIKHSIHVAMLGTLIGDWMVLSDDSLYEIAMTGMLHDIGKVHLSESLLRKAEPLTDTEWSFVQQHPDDSFEIVKAASAVSLDVLQAIANHHERMDGSGYPHQLTGEDIHPYAKIIAVADSFDAMITKRPYGQLHNVFEAADILFDASLTTLDTKAVDTLLRNLHKLYVGTKVRLSNNTDGEIVYVNKFNPNKPLIKSGEIFYDLLSPDSPKIVQIL